MATEKNQHWYNVLFPNGVQFPGDTDGIIVPSGTLLERPSSPINGTIRYNTTDSILEGYASGAWVNLSSPIPTFVGIGSPETVVSAPVGSLYTDSAGGPGTTLYVKESGIGASGWIAK